MKRAIIVADDDASVRKVLTRALTSVGCQVHATSLLTTLARWTAEGRGDLVITDVAMPDGNGIDQLKELRKIRPELPVIVISAQNTIMTAIQAEEAEAFSYLPKPFDLPELLNKVREALQLQHHKVPSKSPVEEEDLPLVGRAPIMQLMYKSLAKTINSNLPLHLFGETGSGKSKVAQVVHDCSDRRSLPFLYISPQQLEDAAISEGLFSRATSGTIVLEEVADLSPIGQQVLVRQLDNSNNSVRVISTSQKNLSNDMAEGRFPRDLYFRLCGDVIEVPPLRQRSDDIPLLAGYFLQHHGRAGGIQVFTEENMPKKIASYRWPGNVRELKNALDRATMSTIKNEITWQDISNSLYLDQAVLKSDPEPAIQEFRQRIRRNLDDYLASLGTDLPAPGLYNRIIKEIEIPLITALLAATRDNRAKCAEILGINRNTLRKKIKDLDISSNKLI